MDINFQKSVEQYCLRHNFQIVEPSPLQIKSNNTKLKLICNRNHTRTTRVRDLLAGRKCKKCYVIDNLPNFIRLRKQFRNSISKIVEINGLLKSRNIKCLSKMYIEAFSKLEFECQDGHKWFALWNAVKHGGGCPKCNLLSRSKKSKYQPDVCQKFAETKYGKCLSTVPERYMTWQCYFGHIWKSRATDIIYKGQWCGECSSSLSERICRLVFETIFEKKFPKFRSEWLKNSNGYRLELDGYCKELNFAFEHHGRQHYNMETLFFDETKSESKLAFDHARNNDLEKAQLCAKNGIKLIVIPELFKFTKIENLKSLIKDFCIKENISFDEDLFSKPINPNDVYKLNYINNIDTGSLKCLSESYSGRKSKLKWECSKNHIWEENLFSLKKRKFSCKECKKIKKLEGV